MLIAIDIPSAVALIVEPGAAEIALRGGRSALVTLTSTACRVAVKEGRAPWTIAEALSAQWFRVAGGIS